MWCRALDRHRVESCPIVKAVEYAPDGSLSRVEKFSPRELHVPSQDVLPFAPVPYLLQPPSLSPVWTSDAHGPIDAFAAAAAAATEVVVSNPFESDPFSTAPLATDTADPAEVARVATDDPFAAPTL